MYVFFHEIDVDLEKESIVHDDGEKLLQKRQKLMSLLIRFWDRELSSLSSHVLTSFHIKLSTFHMWKLHSSILIMYLYLHGAYYICIYNLYNLTF